MLVRKMKIDTAHARNTTCVIIIKMESCNFIVIYSIDLSTSQHRSQVSGKFDISVLPFITKRRTIFVVFIAVCVCACVCVRVSVSVC